jgi:amino acid permease
MTAIADFWNATKKRFSSKDSGPSGHSIGYWGGVCLLANNITGPGMVLIPSVFAQSGWLFPTVLFVVTGSLSALSVLYLAKSLTLIPGNEKLQKRMEFAPLIKMLFPSWLYRITFFGLLLLLQITNIGSIVISAQTMDYTAMTIGGKTCALTLYSNTWSGSYAPLSGSYIAGDSNAVHPVFQCIVSGRNSTSTKDSVFGEDYVLSIGYVIVAIIVIPMGIFNLEDNIWVQKGGFVGLVFCVIAWLVQFMFVSGIDTSLTPAIGDYSSWGPSISLIVFNFGFTLTVPSWIHEKEPSISTSSSVWASVIISGRTRAGAHQLLQLSSFRSPPAALFILPLIPHLQGSCFFPSAFWARGAEATLTRLPAARTCLQQCPLLPCQTLRLWQLRICSPSLRCSAASLFFPSSSAITL